MSKVRNVIFIRLKVADYVVNLKYPELIAFKCEAVPFCLSAPVVHSSSLICQVSIRLDGDNKAVEYNAVGLTKDAVRAVFKNPEVDNLFDRSWHKIALSVEAKSVSLYLDCKHIQTLPIEDREDIDIQGKTVIGKRLYDSVPINVSRHFSSREMQNYTIRH